MKFNQVKCAKARAGATETWPAWPLSRDPCSLASGCSACGPLAYIQLPCLTAVRKQCRLRCCISSSLSCACGRPRRGCFGAWCANGAAGDRALAPGTPSCQSPASMTMDEFMPSEWRQLAAGVLLGCCGSNLLWCAPRPAVPPSRFCRATWSTHLECDDPSAGWQRVAAGIPGHGCCC